MGLNHVNNCDMDKSLVVDVMFGMLQGVETISVFIGQADWRATECYLDLLLHSITLRACKHECLLLLSLYPLILLLLLLLFLPYSISHCTDSDPPSCRVCPEILLSSRIGWLLADTRPYPFFTRRLTNLSSVF